MNTQFDIELGRTLKSEREARGWSQQDIADKLGCSKMSISYWETGQRSMYAVTLRKYCEILGITMQSVMDRIDLPEEI